jgi:selenocysteine lyase/cysteine desulfurase
MSLALDELRGSPNGLAVHYSAFRVAERLLLTGHSHQAWPDVAFEGQKRAWLDAAELVDGKWDAVAEKVERVAEGYRGLMGGCEGDFTLEANTHALVVRFLSALPLRERPRIVTTDGEFHSIRRQLDRLAEEGIEVVKVGVEPVDTLAERLAARVDDDTACAMVSSVLFGSGLIVPELAAVAVACEAHGAELLVDAYHSLGVVPFSLDGLQRAFVVGGGYKYLQLGEGNCVLRVPPDCGLRPVVTGWFAEFADLADAKVPGEVRYGKGPARFAGSTFDPTSAYRAAAVLDFFDVRALTPDFLRRVSQHQVGLLVETFESLDLSPDIVRLQADVPIERRGGFLALEAPEAARLHAGLLDRGVRTDYRGAVLRFGPAPYLSDAQIVEAMRSLGEVTRRA